MTYDRSAEDVGNIVNFGHLNTTIPDQRLSTAFYVAALGLTRDPYLNTGTNNMWINVGVSQFHLPTRQPQVVRGSTGIVMPDLEALLRRLHAAKGELDGTRFAFRELEGAVETISPWGNRILVHAPDPARFGPIALGMAYLDFDVPAGAAAGIARFYTEIIAARGEVIEDGGRRVARVTVGDHQHMLFSETDHPLPSYDDHHVQIYLADFSGPHRRLVERSLLSEESSRYQYRFVNIIDPRSGELLYTLEHEVRSMTHPLYGRPLVNRNPAITNNAYAAGQEELARWSLA